MHEFDRMPEEWWYRNLPNHWRWRFVRPWKWFYWGWRWLRRLFRR